MATKKERRSAETKSKKIRKGKRIAILSGIGVAVFGFLVFFFVSVFNMVYPPVSGRDSVGEKKEVVLYFSDKNELFLVPEKRFVRKEKSPEVMAKRLTLALIEGSKTGNVGTFPVKAGVRNVKIGADGVAYVNFSREFIKSHPGGTTAEIATVYSLTNTLARNIPSIQSVKILVEDKPIRSIKGHVSTDGIFRLDKERIIEGSRDI